MDAFTGFVVFQPIINGIGGNLVSVQASKISTFLHQSTIPGIIPPHTKIFENPLRALVTSGKSLSVFVVAAGKETIPFCSSLRTGSQNFDTDVNSRSTHIHFRGGCSAYGLFDTECSIRFFVHVR